MPVATAKQLIQDLKTTTRRMGRQYQYAFAETKAVSKGVRLGVFMLATPQEIDNNIPGDKEADIPATSKEQWSQDTGEVVARLEKDLSGCIPYVEEWNPERKFQFRFETYIKYAEL